MAGFLPARDLTVVGIGVTAVTRGPSTTVSITFPDRRAVDPGLGGHGAAWLHPPSDSDR